MDTIKLNLENTSGQMEEVTVKVTNPNVRRTTGGKSYRFGDLVKLANGNVLTEKQSKDSPALVGMKPEQAKEMVTEAFLNESKLLEEVITEPVNETKVAELPKQPKSTKKEAAKDAKAEAQPSTEDGTQIVIEGQ